MTALILYKNNIQQEETVKKFISLQTGVNPL